MDVDAKKRVLRLVPYGLYAACTRSNDGKQHIFLLSWVTQASFDPPLIVCCIHRESTSHANLVGAGPPVLTVNVLGVEQKDLGKALLKGPSFESDTVAGTPFRPGENGCAVLTATLGTLEAEVVERISKGDHSVFVCRVTEVHHFRDGETMTHASTGWKYAG